MQSDHYAILVGIDRYPQLGPGNTPLDLRGPRNDVAAVRQWLRDPAGGGFADDSTIFEFQAPAGTPPGAAMPTAAQLDDLVARLDQIAQDNKDQGRGRQVGRRIYIYLSGHGFSPGRQRACLFTADAQERLGHNVHATGWLSWLQDSGYFREFVLWVDACMDRAAFLPPHDPPLPLTTSLVPPLANFVAFAAQRPLRAVELPIEEDGGRVHGVFTWTLLEGLRGAAADVNGRVTGRSLADWVRNAMVARYGDAERKDPNVAQEPEVIQEDAGLIFARGLAAPLSTLKLVFPPAAEGRPARIWSGAPPRVVQSFTVAAAGNEVALKPGLYLAEVPDQALRQGFEVLRPGAVQVGDAGVPARACDGSEIFTLSIDPRDPTAEIFVIDSRFSLVDRGVAALGTRLPAGLFKAKVRVGNATRQDVVLLDGDATLPAAAAPPQQVATVLPLPDTAATHEYHEGGRQRALDAARALQAQPGEAVLLCLVRSFSSRDAPVMPARPPWQGMQVFDAQGRLVLDMDHDAQVEAFGDPLAFAVKKLAPGCYFLRQPLDGQGVIEQSLVLAAGWRTEAYMLRRTTAQAQDAEARPRTSVLMGRLGADPAPLGQERVLEVARQALADERKVLNPELEDLLMQKFDDPVAGIIGGHLLLVERERDPARDLGRLDGVVRRLQGLVGSGHPDVAALALRCADPQLRQPQGLTGPPMFQRSWALLAAAAADQPALVPPAVWARVHALSAMPPFLVWNTADEVKAAARRALAEALFAPEAPVAAPAPAVPAMGPARPALDLPLAQRRAARMGIPASMVDSLRADLDR
ncbi:MAG: hypothetical protein KGL68_12760 [Burkholderiales bacterium]|nr:hypothetical protein [Burkholderiales bacterium]